MNYGAILTSAISFISLLLAGYTFLSKSSKENTTEITTVIVGLDAIRTGITEIKQELNSIKADQRADHDELIKLQASVKSAWKYIDKLTGNIHRQEQHIEEEAHYE